MIYKEQFTLHCDSSFFREGDWTVNINSTPCKVVEVDNEEGKIVAQPLTWFGKILYKLGLL